MKTFARLCKIRQLLIDFRKCHYSNKPQYNVSKVVKHRPVMVKEVLKYLNLDDNNVLIDMTFGAGGHSEHILKHRPNTTIIALDRDPIGHKLACEMAEQYPNQIIPLLGKFSELPELIKSIGYNQNSIDGILYDFGCSSMQFDTANRGFSVSKDGPLDMRMDGDRFPYQITAMDVLERSTELELSQIFKIYGEEKQHKKIARAIVESRYLFRKLETTQELGDLVSSVCEGEERVDKLNRRVHTATKVFQALRIFVNNELNEINQGMLIAHRYLKIGGRMVALTFHSLEDTIIKRHIEGNIANNVANSLPLRYIDQSITYDADFVASITDSSWKSILKHVIVPTSEEVEENSRSRSAKLRAAIKVK